MAGQNPLGYNVQQAGSTKAVPTIQDGPTALSPQAGAPVAGISGTSSALGVSTSTVIKAAPGRLIRAIVTTAGAAGAVYDCLTVGAVGPSNLIAVIPATVGPLVLEFPCLVGIVYVPGAAQVASFSFS